MKNRNIYLYIAGAFFFAMCGSLWQQFVAPLLSDSRDSADSNIHKTMNHEPLNHEPRAQKAPGRYYAVPKTAVESFPFDPNEADSTQLLRLGLTPAQVRSIYRHRAKGYVYSTPEDFARTPFMTKGQWNHLKPLIKIGDQYRLLNAKEPPKTVNSQLSIVNSHTADSSATAKKDSIVNSQHSNKPNAEKLAYSAEARRMSMDEIHELSIINLNESSFKDLVHHPFLSYDQVKAVKNFQRKYGRIRNMTELLILPEFTVEDTLRLSPYLQF